MWLINRFNRVVEIDDEDDAARRIKAGRMRKATDQEVARFLAERETASTPASRDGVYYRTVRSTPDGYGMSRDHIKFELAELGVKLAEAYAEQKVALIYNYPYEVLSVSNDVRLLYTMFESDKIPEDWEEYLRVANEVLVPSKWCADVFAKDGIATTVVPLGYNDRVFTYQQRPEREVFTFIHYDSFNLRKGFKEVFEAFTQEFTKDEPVRMILKTVQEHTSLPIVKSVYPNIEVVRGVLAEAELVELLQQADCMVYPSRGEGFGITPLEAMATGLPAIVPNAHGISEYFNANYMLEVKVGEWGPALNNRFKGQNIGDMAVCDVDHLRKQMRYAFEHQEEMRELGRAASEYVKNYTYRHTAERLAAVIKKWEATEVVKRGDSKFLQVERV